MTVSQAFETPSGKIELVSEITKKFNLGTYPEYQQPMQPTARVSAEGDQRHTRTLYHTHPQSSL